MRIFSGYRNTGEQHSGFVRAPSACLVSSAFHWALSDLVHCIHTFEHSKREGLLAVAQNCTQCEKKKRISWISVMGSVKKYRRDVA